MSEEYDLNSEPCSVCGREPAECVCALAPDFPDEELAEIEDDHYDWDFYGEETVEGGFPL